MECSQTCGRCHRSEQCDHLTGHCPNGCDPGRFGEKCVNGNSLSGFSFYICVEVRLSMDNSTDLSKNKISANSHQKVRRLKLLKLYCPFQPNNNFRRIAFYSVY